MKLPKDHKTQTVSNRILEKMAIFNRLYFIMTTAHKSRFTTYLLSGLQGDSHDRTAENQRFNTLKTRTFAAFVRFKPRFQKNTSGP